MSHDDIDELLNLPIGERGEQLARVPENQWFERKSIRVDQKSFAKAIIGMANAEGGTVVVGLSEQRVEGIDSNPSRTNELRQVPMTMVAPPLRAHFREVSVMNDRGAQDHLLIAQVPPSRHAHRRSDDTAFLRMGDSTVKLDGPMWEELVYDREAETYEAQPAGITMAELSGEAIDRLRVEIGAHGDDSHVLRSRSLLTHDGKPTIAALLLFGIAPEQLLPQALVRVLRYREDETGTGARQTMEADGDRRLEGPIPDVIAKAAALIDQWAPKRRALNGGTFGPTDVIPRDAWLEAVVNAVVHRSYSMAGDHIRVSIFPHRIEVSSPGRFPGLSDPSRPLEIARYARNPRIARVCADLGITQELGEGIRRMVDDMRRAGLSDPHYRQTSTSVIVRLDATSAISSDVIKRLPHGSLEIVTLLRSTGPLATGEIASGVNASRPTVLRWLKRLREEGLVERRGQSPRDPRATWYVPGT
ncbi:ArsR family transcriptional regulator [Actinomyces viscosus]|uniref:Predicted transcriptional regulator n=1 Tax=Actinomyces viscosus TaxID=1656 RepID=A0A3S4Z9F6_ACTVI|nr:ATP-binding protein [Actinomyces viscosus]TFH52440.1 ArsR family transcriptional regulator [Actinomyces viscosus]VEI17136.1 Predicted transcriptional regulator [Actinomyces viscosus]